MKYAIIVLLLLLTGCAGLAIGVEEEGSIELYFCDKQNCTRILHDLIKESEDVQCALYRIDYDTLRLMQSKAIKFITDGDAKIKTKLAKKEKGTGLMHNKFCVFDGRKVLTGSWNPTQKNTIANNMLVIDSKVLAKAYLDEYEEMNKGNFHGGKKSSAKVKLSGIMITLKFCPEDSCQKAVLEELKGAKESVMFMTFSFTDDKIGNVLLEKSKEIEVKGMFDPRKDKWSDYNKLKQFSKIKKLHHKVFIIDNSTVITGSYNPTRNGNERNDENMLIIKDKKIAEMFVKEFEQLFN